MFLGFRFFTNGTKINPPLLGKGTAADIGLVFTWLQISKFINKPGNLMQLGQLQLGNTVVVELQGEIWNNRTKIGIPAPFPNSIHSASGVAAFATRGVRQTMVRPSTSGPL